ncbi:MAG: cell envelope biogenesis protein OmpA [Crocinitomicaceae bacterium]|jgi:chemotaxis protein MotB|nr:cell envelope biogenesis protein OmpA [Crocinitomicaceae bacterium]|tara:strand:+ start:262 stop:1248 length:987 start_codon:yes stop_codon:yes gene_type:complete
MKKILIYLLISSFFFQGCVPARKFEEISEKQEVCAGELKTLKTLKTELQTENTELESINQQLKELTSRLIKDTTILGKSLRMKEKQYDKIDLLNKRIQDQLEMLQKGQSIEKQRLMADLEKRKSDLLILEDQQRAFEIELNNKKQQLEDMSIELQKREQRVNELEEIIANKDAMVRALKEKVANALLGFRDKGLSVIEKDGKVYISMDAKLLFASGSTKVDSEGIKALKELAKVLEDQKDLEILVEGHTDTDKMRSNSHPVDNWELSVLRATSVVKIMLENSKMDPTTVSASGRSQFIPIDIENKAKNRRIEVVLIPKLDELFEIINN